MTAAQPQTTYNSLVERINVFMRSSAPPTAFELRRLEQEIAKLTQADAAQGWLVAAMLSSYQWDAAATSRNVSNALSIAAREPNFKVVASQCLWNVGLYQQAEDLTANVMAVWPKNIPALKQFVEQSTCFGRIAHAADAAKQLETMEIQLEPGLPSYTHSAAFLSDAGISLARVEREAALAMEVLAKQRLRLDGVLLRPWIDPEDGIRRFAMIYEFSGTFDQEMQAEAALADRLMDDPEWQPDLLSTEFRAVPYPQ